MYSRTEKGGIKVTVESRKREGHVQVEEDDSWEEQGTCVELLLDKSFPFSISVGSHAHHFWDNQYDQFNKDDHIIYYALKDCKKNRIEDVIIMKSEEGGVDLWDCRDFVFCHLSCGTHTGTTTKFKGKILNRSPYYWGSPSSVRRVLDFYGLDTREYLEISRKDIKREKTASITLKVERLMHCLVDFLIKQDHLDFLCAKNSSGNFTPDFYYILWQLADNKQKKVMLKREIL